MEAQMAEHLAVTKQRFETGNEAFSAMRESIGQLSQAVQPRPVSVARVVGLTVTMVLAAGAALWALSAMIADRPRIEQVREVISDHASNGHPSLTEDIAGIKQEQAVQRVKLESIAGDVAEIKAVIAPRLAPVRRPR